MITGCDLYPDRCACGPNAAMHCSRVGKSQHISNNPHLNKSFHYKPKKDTEEGYMFHDVRSRIEREAMERMTRIYNNRKEVNEALLNFPSISDEDVYGQVIKKTQTI